MSEKETIISKSLKEAMKLAVMSMHLQVQGHDVMYPYIAGAPGGGKTASMNAIAKNAGWGMLSTHWALKPIEENGGIPQFTNIKIAGKDVLGTIWSFPDIMKQLYELSEQFPVVLWLLDDIHLSGAQHGALLYELLTERKLRDHKIPNNCAIALAGNHASNKAGAKTMLSAIMNRVALYPVYTDVAEWKTEYALPNEQHVGIVSFVSHSQYQQFFHEDEQIETPWGSPRSWSRLGTKLQAMESWMPDGIADDVLLYEACAHVSREASSEFVQYYKVFNAYNIPEILKVAETYELPDDAVGRYAFAYALTSFYSGKSDRSLYTKSFAKLVFKYVKKYHDLGLMILKEIIELEKATKTKLYIPLAQELNSMEPGITTALIKEVSDVD